MEFTEAGLVARLQHRQNIGIFGGISRGGLGDLASNLYVAKQMVALNPNLNVYIILHDEIVPDYQKLVFDFDPDATSQKRYGLTFIRGDAIDKMKFSRFMGFSMAQPQMMGVVHCRLGRDMRSRVDSYEFYGEYSEAEESTDQFSTGLFALYVSPEKPTILPRDELNKWVQNRTGVDIANRRIAFRYGHGRVTNLSSIANDPDVVVFSDFPLGSQEESPQIQCKIVTPRLDLLLSEQLIAHADFPVLVTGDVSLSMALEHEKPFSYRGSYWKKPFSVEIANFFGVEDSGGLLGTHFRVASDDYDNFRKMRKSLSIHNTLLSHLYNSN